MRARLLSLVMVCLAIGLAGCEQLTVTVPLPGSGTPVRGSGNVVTQQRQVSGFTAVSLSGIGDLRVSQTGAESLTIEAEDNLIPLILTAVVGGKLVISYQPNSNINAQRPIIFHLTVKDLKELDLTGAGSADVSALNTGDFVLNVQGAGDCTFTGFNATSLKATLDGAGKATLSGKASSQTVTLSGAGNYEAADLATSTATLHISGAGNAVVRVSTTLDVDISGAGNVEYIGDPKVTQQVSGAGTVRKRS